MVNATSNNTTEEKILQAARKIFVMKGMTGSRMQDIADEAGINKALLHYYFRNKEKLFEVVFWEAANELFLKMNGVFESNLGLLDKIRLFSMEYIEMVLKAPFIPQFLFTEINRNPDDFFSKLEKLSNKPNPRCFLGQFQEAMDSGLIRKAQPLEFMMNIMSMIVFPFIGKPMFQKMFAVEDTDFISMMESRKTSVADFVINAIKLKPNDE